MSGPLPIRQNATHKVVVGPAVAVGDGFTPVTTLALSTADEAEVILHDNATVVDISGYTWAAITTADGYYHLTLQSGISGTVGHMTVVVNDDSLCLPLRADFIVMEEATYDLLYASGATGNTAAVTTIASDLVIVQSDLLQVYSDTTIVASDLVQVYSDTTLLESSRGVVAEGTAQSGTASTVVLAAATSIPDDIIIGASIWIVSGTGAGQARRVTDWANTTDTATISPNWTTNPSSDSVYKVYATPQMAIDSQIAQIQSDLIIVASDLLQVYSDTTILVSDTTAINTQTTTIASDLVIIASDLLQVYSDTTIIASDLVQIYSDTTAIEAAGGALSAAQASQLLQVQSDLVQVYSDTTIIVSDTTAINTQTTTIASDLVQIYSDTTIIVSDTTAIENGTTIVNANLEQINTVPVVGDGSGTPFTV